MVNYRLYRLDGTGKITGAEWLAADGDDHATRLAREVGARTTLEVWNRNRLIARVDPDPKSTPAG